MLTQEQVQSMFDYHSDGHLVWKIKKPGVVKGSIAGTLDTNGYHKIMINYKYAGVHRLIFLFHHGFLPKYIDHIDGNKSNNKICKLRECSHVQNCQNRKKSTRNTSGYKGVSWHIRHKKYIASIQIDGKLKYLGSFEKAIDAYSAYTKAALNYYGDFARLL